MHDFTRTLRKKGYTIAEAAEYWGVTPNHLSSRVSSNPSRRWLLLLDALPDRNGPKPKDKLAQIAAIINSESEV